MRILILVLIFMLAASGNALAVKLTDASNRHNLSNTSSNTIRATLASGETRICVFCHTPHGASAESALWNRNDPTITFSLYNSGTLYIDDPAISATTEYSDVDSSKYPNGATRMCLSCHDRVSAIGEVLNGPAIAMLGGGMPSSGEIKLVSSHPVSFVYTGAVVTYVNAQEIANGDGGVYKLPDFLPLDGNQRMQCTTCHDPHEDTRSGFYDLPFWRYKTGSDAAAANADYDFTCQDCHDTGDGDWGGSWPGFNNGAPVH